jgi:predicted permease
MLHDLRFAIRTLRRSPGYTLAALLTLMLGIGANAAVFSVAHGILLAPLPFAEPDRLVRAQEENAAGRTMAAAWRNFIDWRERARSFAGLIAHSPGGVGTVLADGVPARVGTVAVSRGFLPVMGALPQEGRGFLDEEHVPGAAPAVLVSDAFWRTHLGATSDLASRRLVVSGVDAQIVGVMPVGFDYPGDTDVWYPLELVQEGDSRTAHNYIVIGRLRAGIDATTADAELDAITDAFLTENPGATDEDGFADYFPRTARVESLHRALVGATARPLWILLGASVLVLLVGCVNLASATLARGTARAGEYAVRRSLGAARGRLLRQLFTESAVLALAGGALALLLAAAALRALPALAPAGIPRIDEVTLHPLVMGGAIVLSLLTAVLFGLLPALRVTEGSYAGVLRGGRGSADRGQHAVWKVLVAVEVALAIVLLAGAGLLIRSFGNVLRVDPGFRTEGLLTATVAPPESQYSSPEARRVYYESLLREMEATPGIARVGLVSAPPMQWVSNGLVGIRAGSAPGVSGDYVLVAGDAFGALGIPLVQGRTFEERDREGAEHVVIVNRAFADLAWPGQSPIGRQMTGGGIDNYWDQDVWARVIGVVGNVRQRELTQPPSPAYYFALAQRPFRSWSMTAIVEPAATVDAVAPALREAVRRVDANVPVELSTIEARVSNVLTPRRFTMLVLGVFSAVALALAFVGIWGVVSYAVARRTREIGIRMALGAEAGAVQRRIQLDYLGPALIGGVIGLAGALGVTRVMQSLLFETSSVDPVTFGLASLVLGGAAWVASYIPSLRGTRISPMETMRAE